MINIEELKKEDVGREVQYKDHNDVHYGVITSWNRTYIFVRYSLTIKDNDNIIHLTGQTSQATSPNKLYFTI